jgi:hypothetical protein
MSNDILTALLSNPTVTPGEFMQITRSGKNSTYKAILAGQIPSFAVGDNLKIPTAWLRAKLGLTEVA